MRKVLTKKFFDRSTLAVARDLLGKYIVRRYRGREIALMISEVEAYDGPHDKASHASRGRILKNGRAGRAAIMFGESGRFYVYFTYGMHWLANVVVGAKDYPAAVLLRAGIYENTTRKNSVHKNSVAREKILIKGPARLTKFLHINKAQNALPAEKKSKLWFEDRGVRIPRGHIVAAKRVGVDYAGSIWAEKEYNFKIKLDSMALR